MKQYHELYLRFMQSFLFKYQIHFHGCVSRTRSTYAALCVYKENEFHGQINE